MRATSLSTRSLGAALESKGGRQQAQGNEENLAGRADDSRRESDRVHELSLLASKNESFRRRPQLGCRSRPRGGFRSRITTASGMRSQDAQSSTRSISAESERRGSVQRSAGSALPDSGPESEPPVSSPDSHSEDLGDRTLDHSSPEGRSKRTQLHCAPSSAFGSGSSRPPGVSGPSCLTAIGGREANSARRLHHIGFSGSRLQQFLLPRRAPKTSLETRAASEAQELRRLSRVRRCRSSSDPSRS